MPNSKKHFLFLQGPYGPFFKLLGKYLNLKGHSSFKINFNAGDWIYWTGGISYKNSINKWSSWILNFTINNNITDLVLYGDCRPFHREAIKRLSKLNIKIHVFEEGYLRPNWITYETDGVNGNSKIKDEINRIISSPKYDKGPDDRILAIKNNMYYHVIHCIINHLFRWTGFLLFPLYRTHRQINSFYELLMWVRRYVKLKFKKSIDSQVNHLINNKIPYYLFLSQISNDSQIIYHSPFKNMKEVLIKLIYSFTFNSDCSHKLVIKNHPLDNGQKNYGKLISKICAQYNIKNRVIYLESGNLPSLIDHSLGVVTVNSTAGIQAIHRNKPVKILGNAIYDNDKLINTCSLDTFWTFNRKPDKKAYKRFRNYLLRHNQINGSYYDPLGLKILMLNIVDRIVQD